MALIQPLLFPHSDTNLNPRKESDNPRKESDDPRKESDDVNNITFIDLEVNKNVPRETLILDSTQVTEDTFFSQTTCDEKFRPNFDLLFYPSYLGYHEEDVRAVLVSSPNKISDGAILTHEEKQLHSDLKTPEPPKPEPISVGKPKNWKTPRTRHCWQKGFQGKPKRYRNEIRLMGYIIGALKKSKGRAMQLKELYFKATKTINELGDNMRSWKRWSRRIQELIAQHYPELKIFKGKHGANWISGKITKYNINHQENRGDTSKNKALLQERRDKEICNILNSEKKMSASAPLKIRNNYRLSYFLASQLKDMASDLHGGVFQMGKSRIKFTQHQMAYHIRKALDRGCTKEGVEKAVRFLIKQWDTWARMVGRKEAEPSGVFSDLGKLKEQQTITSFEILREKEHKKIHKAARLVKIDRTQKLMERAAQKQKDFLISCRTLDTPDG